MALLVDDCLWTSQGRRWCHLVSDSDLAELHRFAESVGLPRRAFHGDHYDVPAEWRATVVEAGAVEVSSRELLRRLRDGGLRLAPAARRVAHADDQATLTTHTATAITETATGAA